MREPIERRKVRERAERLGRGARGWPRRAWYFDRQGRRWQIEIPSPNDPPTMQQLVDGELVGEPVTIEPTWGRAPHELEPAEPARRAPADEDDEPID